MPALKTERRIYMWRLVPHPIPKESGKTVTLAEVLDAIKYEYSHQRADMYIGEDGGVLESGVSVGFDSKNRMYLADISEPTTDTIAFLINRGDPNVVNPGFIADNNAVREVTPNANETPGASAHLLISTKLQPDGSYRACFEYMPHVSSTHTERLLQNMLTRFAKDNPLKYSYQKKTKGKKGAIITETHEYRPVLNVKKVPSESIAEDIEKGELAGITLIDSHYEYNGPDSSKIEKKSTRRLNLKLSTTGKQAIEDLIGKITPWAKQEHYTEIQFETENEGKRHPKFSLDIQDAKEMIYSKSQTLKGFNEELKGCYPKLADVIVKRLVEFIGRDSEWA